MGVTFNVVSEEISNTANRIQTVANPSIEVVNSLPNGTEIILLILDFRPGDDGRAEGLFAIQNFHMNEENRAQGQRIIDSGINPAIAMMHYLLPDGYTPDEPEETPDQTEETEQKDG
jgi:hypothetical protein